MISSPRDSREYSAGSKPLAVAFFLKTFLTNAQRLVISAFVKITRMRVSNIVLTFVLLLCALTQTQGGALCDARLYVCGRGLGAMQNSQGLVEFHSTVAAVTSQIPGGTAILSRNFSQGSDTDTYLDGADEVRMKQGEGWRRTARKKKDLTSL